MKLTFLKNDLLKSINIVTKAVSSNTTMPILKCILIEAMGDDIIFTSNNTQMVIQTRSVGIIEEKGSAAIDARLFSDIVRKLPDNKVVIETNERMIVTISCENAVFNIPGLEGDKYPQAPEISNSSSVSLSQYSLKNMITSTIFSININDSNKMMSGELFEISNQTLRIAALDGHRIAIRTMDLVTDHENVRVIVPGKTLSEISKLLSDNLDDTVTITFSENNILFRFDETSVYSRLIEGNYYDIDRMIRADYKTELTINKKNFYECIERAGLFVHEDENKPIVFHVSDGYIEINIQTTRGAMNETLEIEKFGNDIKIGFNPKFLTDPLKVIEEENVVLYLIDGKSPCFIKNEQEGYLYLILPVNIL